MQSVTVRLDELIDPVELGARTGMLWSRHGLLLAGIGEHLRIPIERPGGAAAAQAALEALAGANEV